MNEGNSLRQLSLKPLDENVSITAEFSFLKKLWDASDHLHFADGADEHVQRVHAVDVEGVDRMTLDLTDVGDDDGEDETESEEDDHAGADNL